MRLREHIAQEMIEDLNRISHDNTGVLKRQAGPGTRWGRVPCQALSAAQTAPCTAVRVHLCHRVLSTVPAVRIGIQVFRT